MNFFLFQFYYYSLKEDNAIQVSLKPELFGIKCKFFVSVFRMVIELSGVQFGLKS